ncbi:ATP-binding protein [Phaeodactylibacter luteus]|nr:ATP-binding protein [Phaeodactylibacter luteus]
MNRRKYPLGEQDFPSIREEGKVYVDKTMYALHLIETSKSNFLSKPRRFGKSLFLSTLESIFLGKKELFEGLYIYDKWQFEEYPIIRMSFSNIGYKTLGLQKAIAIELSRIAERYDIKLEHDAEDIANNHKGLIEKLSTKYNKGVVILIDEYDKPLIDFLEKDKIGIAKENRDILKVFYSILKDAEPYIKFLLITGVSKFSKVSIFSDLNNLTDIALDPDFNEICGISQQELEDNFVEELKLYDKEKIKAWYNGYKWDINGNTLYNPFSILTFFKNKGKFENYWYSTGTPTFLMKMCREQHLYKFDEIAINKNDLGNFDIENLKIEPLLFQTGYLTIVKEDSLFGEYILSFPNKEVKESYLRNLLEAYIDSQQLHSSPILNGIRAFLKAKDPELFKGTINQAFSHIPYSLWQKENEQYYHALVHLIFSLLGVYIFSEVQTQKGRTDSIVMFENEVFIFEFKLNKSAEEAFFQIGNKGYADKFKDSGMSIYKVGVNFSSEKKEVEEVFIEKS